MCGQGGHLLGNHQIIPRETGFNIKRAAGETACFSQEQTVFHHAPVISCTTNRPAWFMWVQLHPGRGLRCSQFSSPPTRWSTRSRGLTIHLTSPPWDWGRVCNYSTTEKKKKAWNIEGEFLEAELLEAYGVLAAADRHKGSWGWEDWSVVMSTCFSSRGLEFGSRHIP